MDRRDILLNLPLAVLACGLFPGQAVSAPTASAAEIGRWLLAHGVVDPDTDALLADVTGENPASKIQELIRRDFAAGRMVAADGWWISRTEAHICALAALSHSGGAIS